MPLSYPDPPLTDGVILLRRWELTDLACVEEASHDPRIPEGTSVPPRFSDEEGFAWIERQWSRFDNDQGLSLAIADAESGKALGAIVAMFRPPEGSRRDSAELGYWLTESARGRRRAARAVSLLARWALTEGDRARLEALVEPDNQASRHVLESAGFQREGHLRSYLAFPTRRADAMIYSLLPSDLH